jgi:hypothetical protein
VSFLSIIDVNFFPSLILSHTRKMETLPRDLFGVLKTFIPVYWLWTCQFVCKSWREVFWNEEDRKALSLLKPVPGCLLPDNLLAHYILIDSLPRDIDNDSDNNNSNRSTKKNYVRWFLDITKYPINGYDMLFAVQSGDSELVSWLEENTDAFPAPDEYLMRAAIFSKNIEMMRKYSLMCTRISRNRAYDQQKDTYSPRSNCFDYSIEDKLNGNIYYPEYPHSYSLSNHPLDVQFTTSAAVQEDVVLSSSELFKLVCAELLCKYYLSTNNITQFLLSPLRNKVFSNETDIVQYACY